MKRTIVDDNDNYFDLSKLPPPMLENDDLLEDNDSIAANTVHEFFYETDELIKSNNKCNININSDLIENNAKTKGLTLLCDVATSNFVQKHQDHDASLIKSSKK